MDDGLQDPQADSLKKEIEILRQTVGGDATSDDDALDVDYGGELSEHDDAPSNGGNIRECYFRSTWTDIISRTNGCFTWGAVPIPTSSIPTGTIPTSTIPTFAISILCYSVAQISYSVDFIAWFTCDSTAFLMCVYTLTACCCSLRSVKAFHVTTLTSDPC